MEKNGKNGKNGKIEKIKKRIVWNSNDTVAQKIAPMFACYGKTHALLNDYIR